LKTGGKAMRNFAVIAMIFCVAALTIQSSVVLAEKIPNKRGLEFRAGFSHYFMDDPNDLVESYPANYSVTTTFGAPMLGVSLLYKTHHNFGWNLGYNYIMNSTPKAEGPETVELTIRGHELFVMGCYYMPISDLTASFGLGLNGVMGWIDRDQSTLGGSFRDATGRSLGFLANIALEYPLKEHLGLKLGAGYRSALIDQVAYRDTNDREHTVYYDNRPMELNFSGFFGQLGLCVYFSPASGFGDRDE
jgi:hypothetical protein